MLSSPLVSVIIPSYNRADKVSHTLDSILSQKCDFDFEIVIGDDFSTDNVREVLKTYKDRYPEKIILLFHEKNIGLAANWATCVKHSHGKYIANCDNDDYWHNENKLQIQVEFMEAHPEVGLCHTNYRIHHREEETIIEVEASKDTKHGSSLQKKVFGSTFKCCNATVMYRKEMLEKYVNLDDFIKYQFTLQDWNTWVILAAYANFYCLPISTATFGIETESITRPKNFEKLEQRFKQERECYKYVYDLFPNNFPYIEEEYNEYENGVLLNLSYRNKDYKKAKKYGKKLKKRNLKKICSQNFILFNLFTFLKKLRP